ncbi:putative SH2B adapter protein 2 [Hypsibius exemplaris]|uniref:SH2B adapter protein 2 n=1 Tax=Hypsibius exemplaris TaxID=2072580 RepID=A0A1W0WQP6_HYPEX|nr:putative SH2B adapter protein 2 [Hypsibius exemplaris]
MKEKPMTPQNRVFFRYFPDFITIITPCGSKMGRDVLDDEEHSSTDLRLYLDNQARNLAHRLAVKFHSQSTHDEEVLLEYGRRFCRGFFVEFQREIVDYARRSDDAAAGASSDESVVFSDGLAQVSEVDGRTLQLSSDGSSDVISPVAATAPVKANCWGDSPACDGEGSLTDLTAAVAVCHGDCLASSSALADGKRRGSAISLCSTVSGLSSTANVRSGCSNCQSKSFFRRRLSLHGLNPFHRRGSDGKEKCSATGSAAAVSFDPSKTVTTAVMSAVSAAAFPQRSPCGAELRTTRVDMTVEILREHLCTFVITDPANQSGTTSGHHGQSATASSAHVPRWESCRLTLAKTPAGQLLQIFTPPKAIKAKKSIFCCAIQSARDAADADAIGHDCVFIIQLTDGPRYMFRLGTCDEKRGWVYDMQRSGVTQAKIPGNVFPLAGSISRPRLSTFPPTDGRRPSPTAELQPNSATSNPSRSGTPVFETNPITSPLPVYDSKPEDHRLTDALSAFPWFHQAITRAEAAALVAAPCIASMDSAAHGRFLVRASETRPGEFVVTFNAHGKPKHLRISIEPDGQCRVQSLWFESVSAMADHYRQHPLPLESGHVSDVKLTEGVPSQPPKSAAARPRSGSVSSTTCGGGGAVEHAPCRAPATMTHFSTGDSRFRAAQPSTITEEGKGVM